jgi:hypothetical protein
MIVFFPNWPGILGQLNRLLMTKKRLKDYLAAENPEDDPIDGD